MFLVRFGVCRWGVCFGTGRGEMGIGREGEAGLRDDCRKERGEEG